MTRTLKLISNNRVQAVVHVDCYDPALDAACDGLAAEIAKSRERFKDAAERMNRRAAEMSPVRDRPGRLVCYPLAGG